MDGTVPPEEDGLQHQDRVKADRDLDPGKVRKADPPLRASHALEHGQKDWHATKRKQDKLHEISKVRLAGWLTSKSEPSNRKPFRLQTERDAHRNTA
jgi:hypothetical protein